MGIDGAQHATGSHFDIMQSPLEPTSWQCWENKVGKGVNKGVSERGEGGMVGRTVKILSAIHFVSSFWFALSSLLLTSNLYQQSSKSKVTHWVMLTPG